MDLTTKNIVLIGMMGAGKTSVGMRLASALGCDFFDSDQIYTRLFGSIEHTFLNEGEEAFRLREGQILSSLKDKENSVIATGGGAVLSLDFKALKTNALVIYLSAPAKVLHERIQLKDALKNDRPLNKGLASIEEILAKRESTYKQSADFIVETENLTLNEAVDTCLKIVSKAF